MHNIPHREEQPEAEAPVWSFGAGVCWDGGMDTVRARILAAAVELFAEQGYDKTSVQEVVERAGVTKGALYHYFSAKDDLLFEIYRSLLAEQMAGLDRILSERRDAASTVRAIIADLVRTTADHARAAAVFGREIGRVDQERWRELQADWRRYQEAVRGLIRDAQAAGTFAATASPEVVAWTIFGLTTTLPTWYRADGSKSAEDIAAELADLVLTALAPSRR
jgi:AcrR family transcriptional regulator